MFERTVVCHAARELVLRDYLNMTGMIQVLPLDCINPALLGRSINIKFT